jgi:hypothetical protein
MVGIDRNTLLSTSATSSAWCLDITGESKKQLSAAAVNPLDETLLALPIAAVVWDRVRVIDLSGRSFMLSSAVSLMTIAKSCQSLKLRVDRDK